MRDVMESGQDPRTAVTHALKTLSPEFSAVIDGRKRFEWRPDRDFQVGDLLRLMEWDPLYDQFTGSWAMVSVLYVMRPPASGVPPGHCIMSISPVIVNWRDDQRLMMHDSGC